MLLVMGGMNLFYEEGGSETQLCKLTCDRLNSFLPSLKRELFTPPTKKTAGNIRLMLGYENVVVVVIAAVVIIIL